MRRILARIGEDATYTPSGGGAPSTVRGLYQGPYQEALGMEGNDPTFSCLAEDVPTLKQSATFVIRGVTFKVKRVEPDLLSGLVISKLQR